MRMCCDLLQSTLERSADRLALSEAGRARLLLVPTEIHKAIFLSIRGDHNHSSDPDADAAVDDDARESIAQVLQRSASTGGAARRSGGGAPTLKPYFELFEEHKRRKAERDATRYQKRQSRAAATTAPLTASPSSIMVTHPPPETGSSAPSSWSSKSSAP